MLPTATVVLLVMFGAGERASRSPADVFQAYQDRVVTTWSHVIPDTAGIFYQPVNEQFRVRYELDQRNQSRQRWNRYWYWIRTFYKGNILARGWTESCRRILGALPAEYEREELIGRMNVLGRLIAAEWAKNGSVRVIATSDLQRWGGEMRRAMRQRVEDDPAPILRVFSHIERTVNRRISPLYHRY